MRYRLPAILAIVGGIAVLIAAGEPRPPAPRVLPATSVDDEAAVRQAVAAYVMAINAGEVEAIMAVFAIDAEYEDETGTCTCGRDSLSAKFALCCRENKGARVEIRVQAIRVLKRGIALQEGTSIITRPDGESEIVPFSAVWVKEGDKWLVQLVRNLAVPTPEPEPETPQVKELEWLVGEWTAVENDSTTKLTARWMDGQKFLTVDYAVRVNGGQSLSVSHVIGLDPTNGLLRSWAFEKTGGGFGEGFWRRDGDTWTADLSGVTADGKPAQASHSWSPVDENTFTLQAVNREVGGRELPDINLTFRRSGQPK